MEFKNRNSRREFIEYSVFNMAGLILVPGMSFGNKGLLPSINDNILQENKNNKGLKSVAFLCNTYFNQSHADMIGTKLFLGLPMDDGFKAPQVKIVSVWIDQIGDNDTGVRIATMNGATIYPSIAEALTRGGDDLAVDAVVYIGEHGDYQYNRFGEKMYPRLNYLEQVFRTFDAHNKSVPVYSDKHLAYSWLDSKWIYDRAKELKVPMMAGSSLPYAWRNPELQHPIGIKISEAVAIGYGKLDSYGFHVTEILQCMVERRAGGETGVASVHGIQGEDVWAAMDSGEISWELVEAACDTITFRAPGSLRDIVDTPSAVLVKYKDGTKGAVLILNGTTQKRTDGLPSRRGGWAYAAMADGIKVATEFQIDVGLIHSHFSYLTYNIERLIMSGEPQAPLERSLLTSGIIDMGIRSLAVGKSKDTPFLDIKYSAVGYEPYRSENPAPTGRSLGPWPPKGYEFINWKH